MGSPSEEKQYILRGKNFFNVLTILQQKSSISRAELARITHLTPATISNVVAELQRSESSESTDTVFHREGEGRS